MRDLKQYTHWTNLVVLDGTERVRREVSFSKSGSPCMFETGGAWTHQGSAQIITGRHGEKKTPLQVFQRGVLCNDAHAVIPVLPGDYVLEAETKDRETVNVKVYKVLGIDTGTSELNKVWLQQVEDIPDYLDYPISAVADKACTYHCKQAFYIDIKRLKHKPHYDIKY